MHNTWLNGAKNALHLAITAHPCLLGFYGAATAMVIMRPAASVYPSSNRWNKCFSFTFTEKWWGQLTLLAPGSKVVPMLVPMQRRNQCWPPAPLVPTPMATRKLDCGLSPRARHPIFTVNQYSSENLADNVMDDLKQWYSLNSISLCFLLIYIG